MQIKEWGRRRMGTGDEQPQLVGDVVQRKNRDWIGVPGHDRGHRQIDAEYDRTEGGGKHLQPDP